MVLSVINASKSLSLRHKLYPTCVCCMAIFYMLPVPNIYILYIFIHQMIMTVKHIKIIKERAQYEIGIYKAYTSEHTQTSTQSP